MKRIFIPRTVDKPPIFLLWSAEEVMMMTVCMSIGMLVDYAMIMFLGSLLLVKKFRQFETQHPDGYLLHALYWYGLLGTSKHKTMPPTYIKEWVE